MALRYHSTPGSTHASIAPNDAYFFNLIARYCVREFLGLGVASSGLLRTAAHTRYGWHTGPVTDAPQARAHTRRVFGTCCASCCRAALRCPHFSPPQVPQRRRPKKRLMPMQDGEGRSSASHKGHSVRLLWLVRGCELSLQPAAIARSMAASTASDGQVEAGLRAEPNGQATSFWACLSGKWGA